MDKDLHNQEEQYVPHPQAQAHKRDAELMHQGNCSIYVELSSKAERLKLQGYPNYNVPKNTIHEHPDLQRQMEKLEKLNEGRDIQAEGHRQPSKGKGAGPAVHTNARHNITIPQQ